MQNEDYDPPMTAKEIRTALSALHSEAAEATRTFESMLQRDGESALNAIVGSVNEFRRRWLGITGADPLIETTLADTCKEIGTGDSIPSHEETAQNVRERVAIEESSPKIEKAIEAITCHVRRFAKLQEVLEDDAFWDDLAAAETSVGNAVDAGGDALEQDPADVLQP